MKALKTTLIVTFASVLLFNSSIRSDEADSADVSSEQEYFIIETRHRLFPNFSQIDTVGMEQPFYIGEEEYQGEIIAFNPHLGITTKGEALQMSDTLYNPAVMVRVSLEDEIQQESWGFFVLTSPHFRRESLFAFRLVDFKVSEKYVKAPARK
jgi:hypothetical protein